MYGVPGGFLCRRVTSYSRLSQTPIAPPTTSRINRHHFKNQSDLLFALQFYILLHILRLQKQKISVIACTTIELLGGVIACTTIELLGVVYKSCLRYTKRTQRRVSNNNTRHTRYPASTSVSIPKHNTPIPLIP